jgi:hypothetical protein
MSEAVLLGSTWQTVPYSRCSKSKRTISELQICTVVMQHISAAGPKFSWWNVELQELSEVTWLVCCQYLVGNDSKFKLNTAFNGQPMQSGQNWRNVVRPTSSSHYTGQ